MVAGGLLVPLAAVAPAYAQTGITACTFVLINTPYGNLTGLLLTVHPFGEGTPTGTVTFSEGTTTLAATQLFGGMLAAAEFTFGAVGGPRSRRPTAGTPRRPAAGSIAVPCWARAAGHLPLRQPSGSRQRWPGVQPVVQFLVEEGVSRLPALPDVSEDQAWRADDVQ
jgi:hypothetical protein